MYTWSMYCEKPVSEENHLEAIECLLYGMARVIASKHIGKCYRVCIRTRDSGFPSSDDKLGERLAKAGVLIVGGATAHKGDEAVLYTLEMIRLID